MKTRVVNVVILTLVVVLLSLLGFYVRVGVSADSVAVLKTAGMTCRSCSDTISKALEKVKGVVVTEVDVAGGWVVVGYDTQSIKPDVLASQVSKTGFSSAVYQILTPEQFRQITGRTIGAKAPGASGCCGGNSGGCNSNKKS